MRVDYTLPALQPDTIPDMPTAQETGLPFREQLRRPAAQMPPSCEQQLRLDLRPFTATYIGPPPRPPALQLSGVETERLRWHNMVTRHSMPANGGGANGSAGGESVQTMLAMLLDMQHREDSIVALQVALSRG